MLLPLFLLSVDAMLAAAAAVNLLIQPKAFTRKRFAVRRNSNIEVVRLVYTPYTRYSRLVRLSVSTNGTSFSVRSLKEQEPGRSTGCFPAAGRELQCCL